MASMHTSFNFAISVPMANEAKDFSPFINQFKTVLDTLQNGHVYLVVDRASKDNTLELCQTLSRKDSRFITLWSPENRHVVDAYRRGLQEAYQQGHDIIFEMDAGLSHDPCALPLFLSAFEKGYDCVFGSRNICGGSNQHSPFLRRFLSTSGTMLSNLLLGTQLYDMTSGFHGFRREIVQKLLHYPIKSTAHFYQTEVRYLLRQYHSIEVPIHYKNPSPRVKVSSIINSLQLLSFYTLKRFSLKSMTL